MCWGAVIGAGTSGTVYAVATAVSSQQLDLNQFGKAVGMGAIGGVIAISFKETLDKE